MAHIEYATVEDILNYFGEFLIFLHFPPVQFIYFWIEQNTCFLLIYFYTQINGCRLTKCYNFYNTWINDMPCFAVEIYNEVFALLIDKI